MAIYVLGTNLAISGWRPCRNYLATLLSSSLWSKMPDLHWNSDAICHSFRDIRILVFDSHFRLSVIIGIAQGHSSSSPWSKTLGLPLEFWQYLSYFLRYMYFWIRQPRYCYFRLSVVFEITVFEIVMLDSLRFAVKKKQIWRFFLSKRLQANTCA